MYCRLKRNRLLLKNFCEPKNTNPLLPIYARNDFMCKSKQYVYKK